VRDVEVIEDPQAAVVALDTMRARLLAELVEPASAATLAAKVGISRQKVNYHLNALEAHGLVAVVERRQWGGITERILQATASSYIVSPSAVDGGADDPRRAADRLSARYVIALAARVIRDVAALAKRADAEGKRLPTLTIDTEIGFRSAEDRAAFANDLTDAIAALAARYHHDDGRLHRLVATAYPRPEETS
jgi:DNA-binding transcriptional ArsR family regulator